MGSDPQFTERWVKAHAALGKTSFAAVLAFSWMSTNHFSSQSPFNPASFTGASVLLMHPSSSEEKQQVLENGWEATEYSIIFSEC